MIKRKIRSFIDFFIKNKITKPYKLGDNLLILATAPCAAYFFEKESVREQFKDYDLAFVNYMLFYSRDEVFKYKPRYFILMDSIFYDEYEIGSNRINQEKRKVVEILEDIDWECYIVTSVLANFGIVNPNVKYIRLSCFSSSYNKIKLPLFKKSIINLGANNVIQAAIFFAITFGYKETAILGCAYRNPESYMDLDGLHIPYYLHYYDKEAGERIISNDELKKTRGKFVLNMIRRSYESEKCFWDLDTYANVMGCNVVNYSQNSMIDSIKMGQLDI